MQDEQNTDPKHRFQPLPVAAWLSSAVALYFLSTGPILFLYERGVISESTIDNLEHTLYAPIGWLVEKSTLFSYLIEGYLDLWE